MTDQRITSNAQVSDNQAAISLLMFKIADQICSLPIHNVVRIIEMVALTPLPGAPEPIVGVINLQGKVVPILDARLRFGLPQRVYGLYTPIILLEISPAGQMLGLVVDTVEQVVEILPHQFTAAQTIMPTNMVEQMKTQAAYLAGIAMVKQQLIVALSVETLLSLSEQHLLTQALIHQTDPKDGPGKSANEP